MKIVEASTRCTALLGHSGENAAVQVRFQLSEFRKEFPNDERKQYKISVNDDGSLSATEVVE